jgi:hypothetical protein
MTALDTPRLVTPDFVAQPSTRSARQRAVESLLDELDSRRRELYRFKAGGALPAGLRDLKSDYHAVQDRLSHMLEAA